MSSVQELLQAYSRLRGRGTSASVALESLRADIEKLSKQDQVEVVRQVRMIEAMLKSPIKTDTPISSESPTPIKPISSKAKTAQSPPIAPVMVGATFAHGKTANCPRCGKPNPADEILCAHCGNFLQTGKSLFETARLDESQAQDSSYFGEDATLILILRDTNFSFRLRPQDNRHDIVVGRSNGASMKPDVDLLEHNGDQQGVSRLHMSIRYEQRDKTVCVVDMNSANGTFLNGQRLHPREVRVVRHGDELRLGRLVVRVYFQHGTGRK